MATGTSHRPQLKLYDLDVTIVSAKHLKNVNWRNGDLKPYVILWVHPDRRQATKPDDSGSTRPVWNERFVLPLSLPPRDSVLTLEVFHSKPSETSKPLVGALRFELRDLLVDSDSSVRLRSVELLRPSGRPHGKIRLKIGLIEHPEENYHSAPASGYYHFSAPPPHIPYMGYSPPPYSSLPPPPSSFSPPPKPYYSYSDPHAGYYSSYYSPSPSPAPAPASRPYPERQSQSSYGVASGPSAPVDYTPYDYHRRSVAKPGVGIGTGLAVGAVAGALGGMSLEDGIRYEEEKIAERVENDVDSTARDDRYAEYRSDYYCKP